MNTEDNAGTPQPCADCGHARSEHPETGCQGGTPDWCHCSGYIEGQGIRPTIAAPTAPILRRVTVEVTYDPHDQDPSKIDWDYHLRMGDIDAHEVPGVLPTPKCERCGDTGVEWSDYWSQDAEPCRDCVGLDA